MAWRQRGQIALRQQVRLHDPRDGGVGQVAAEGQGAVEDGLHGAGYRAVDCAFVGLLYPSVPMYVKGCTVLCM